jgi:hypothetical protein
MDKDKQEKLEAELGRINVDVVEAEEKLRDLQERARTIITALREIKK